MSSLLRLVSLGSAARNSVKIKVRQPLAELKVQPADERDRRAVERFADQIGEELNVKRVSVHDPRQGTLLRHEIKPNLKSLGPKFGPRLTEVQAALAAADPSALARKAQAGEAAELVTPSGVVLLESSDLIVQARSQDGWAAVADRDTIVAIDVTLTQALKQEGMAREVVRHIQNLRKEANLEMEDRIIVFLSTDSSDLQSAIDAHRDYIAAETLAISWSGQPLGDAAKADLKVDAQPLHMELRKA